MNKPWHLALFSVLWVGGILTYRFWPAAEFTHPPGILVADAPQQKVIQNGKSWQHKDHWVTPLANFRMRARVLSKHNYASGRESELSPVDLALGWGAMSDQTVVDELTITQSRRWYHWRAKKLPLAKRTIITSSANMHIIPRDEELARRLQTVQRGHIIALQGYLVAVRGEDGWSWRSSLRRDDTGNGACEVVWVDQLEIEQP